MGFSVESAERGRHLKEESGEAGGGGRGGSTHPGLQGSLACQPQTPLKSPEPCCPPGGQLAGVRGCAGNYGQPRAETQSCPKGEWWPPVGGLCEG